MALVQVQTGAGKAHRQIKWFRSPRVLRQVVMGFFFAFLVHVAWEHQVKGGGPHGAPSIEAYCPFGGVENLYQFVTTGGFVRHIEPSAMILLGALVLLTLLFSRGFCGWICPFGSAQEWLGLLGRKMFGKRYNPTGPWERRMRGLKYVVLLVVAALTWHLGTLVFRPYDPFLAFFHLGKNVGELPYAYAALGLVLVGSLKYERFFCKYACPLGAVIGIIGKLGLAKIVREDDGCKGCNICQKKCFAHIDFLSTRTISDAECNHCLDCVSFCPKPNVLALRGAGWNLSTPVYASLLVAGLFATIGVSQLSGKWRTKPEMVAFTDKAGKPDAGQIRGWMSLEEVSAGYGIPLRELYQLSGLPEQVEGTTRLNQVASRYGLNFEPDALRETVERYLERPQAGPATKAEMQEARQAPVVPHKATPAPRASKAMAGSGDGVKHEPAQHGQQPGNKDHPGGEQEIRGMMTLNEVVLKTGVPKDFIMRKLAINGEVDARIPLREWMHDKGKSIADVRDAVAEFRAGRN